MKLEHLNRMIKSNYLQSSPFGFIMIIQHRSGCRISEVLKVSWRDIVNESEIIVHCDKGSLPKRVYVPEMSAFLPRFKKYMINPFEGVSRFQMYRLYRRLGISVENGPNKKKSVTHAFRKEYAQSTYDTSNSIEITRDILGHKNTTSTNHYVKRKKANSR